MKAGLMEAADLFVINKADRPGADKLAREISLMIHLRLGQVLKNLPAHHGVRAPAPAPDRSAPAPLSSEWLIPVLKTTAETGAGVEELERTIAAHSGWLDSTGERSRRRRERLGERVRDQVGRRLQRLAWTPDAHRLLAESLPGLESGRVTPYEVAARIVRAVAPE
jgi:LAO/AO transport system kinase